MQVREIFGPVAGSPRNSWTPSSVSPGRADRSSRVTKWNCSRAKSSNQRSSARRSGCASGRTSSRSASCCSSGRPACAPARDRGARPRRRSPARRTRAAPRPRGGTSGTASRRARRDRAGRPGSFTSGSSRASRSGAHVVGDVGRARLAGDERPPVPCGEGVAVARQGEMRAIPVYAAVVVVVEVVDLLVRGGRHARVLTQPAVEARGPGLGRADDHEVRQHPAATGAAPGERAHLVVAPTAAW